jgi:hypothetical protein
MRSRECRNVSQRQAGAHKRASDLNGLSASHDGFPPIATHNDLRCSSASRIRRLRLDRRSGMVREALDEARQALNGGAARVARTPLVRWLRPGPTAEMWHSFGRRGAQAESGSQGNVLRV